MSQSVNKDLWGCKTQSLCNRTGLPQVEDTDDKHWKMQCVPHEKVTVMRTTQGMQRECGRGGGPRVTGES